MEGRGSVYEEEVSQKKMKWQKKIIFWFLFFLSWQLWQFNSLYVWTVLTTLTVWTYAHLKGSTFHSQLLNIVILKFNSSVLRNQLGNIFPYCPVDRAIRRINSSNPRKVNAENIIDILPWAQAIFHCITLPSSQYRYSIFGREDVSPKILMK